MNLDNKQNYCGPSSTTLAEELDKIFQKSPQQQNDIIMKETVNHPNFKVSGPKLNKLAIRRESVGSRNHLSNKIILQKNSTTAQTQRNNSRLYNQSSILATQDVPMGNSDENQGPSGSMRTFDNRSRHNNNYTAMVS